MKKRKMVHVLTSLVVAASFCITSLAGVSTPSKADAATSSTAGRENGKQENVVEALRQDVELEEGVNIEIPMDLSFSIDPINLMEKGQIQSKEYTFKNNSDQDVRITFSEIHYTFSNDEDFRSLKSLDKLNPYSTTKDIFLYLENVSPKIKLEVSDNKELDVTDEDFDPNIDEESEENDEESDVVTYRQMEEQKIIITDEVQNDACSFILSGKKNSQANSITFRFNGAVTEFPEEPWEEGDIEIYVVYDCIFETKEEEIPESLAEIDQTTEAVESTAAESESPAESKEESKDSGSEEGTINSPGDSKPAKETDSSLKESSSQGGDNETEGESEASGGSQSSEEKESSDNKTEAEGDKGAKEEGQNSFQKEEESDKGNDGNHSDNEGVGNSDSEKNDSNSSGKDDSSNSDETLDKSDKSEGSSSSEKTDSETDSPANEKTE